METIPTTSRSLDKYFHINGDTFEKQYNEKLSDYRNWSEFSYADEWLIFSDNLGESICIDETAPSNGELYTLVTNRESRGKKDTIIAIVQGVAADKVIEALMRIDDSKRIYLQIDEVPWRINDTPCKACRKGYVWQFLDARSQSVATYFYYHKGSRAGEIPRAQLKEYRGAIQTDGYAVYDYFEKVDNVTLLSCMAHVRRKFIEAQNNHPKAAVAVKYIGTLYALEENLKYRGANFDEIRGERQEKAVPLMDEMEKWIEEVRYEATPRTLSENHCPTLTNYGPDLDIIRKMEGTI